MVVAAVNDGNGLVCGPYLFELGLGLWHCGGKLKESAECRVAERDGDAQGDGAGKNVRRLR